VTAGGKEGQSKGASRFLASPTVFVRHYVANRAGLFAALFGCAIFAAALSVGVQYGMKLVVDATASGPSAAGAAWVALSVFMGLIAVESLFWRLSGWLAAKATISVGVDIRLDLFQHVAGHTLSYFQDNRAGALGHRITATAGAFGILTNRMVWDIAPPVVNFIGAAILFALLDVWMAATLCVFAAAITAGLILFGLKGRGLHRAYAERAGVVGGELVDVIANVWAIKAFSARDRERARLQSAFDDEAFAQRRSWMYTEKSRILHDLLLLLMAGTMLVWSMLLWQSGRISTGDVVVVSALTFRILHGSRDLALALVDMSQHLAYLSETLRMLGQPHGIVDPPVPEPSVPTRGAVTLNKVNFSYDGKRHALTDLSLHIPSGQKVALVGQSGAGKSTLIHLLARLFEADSGDITIDGLSIKSLPQDSLRAAIAIVPQEVTLFHRSIGDNIRFARPAAGEDEVIAASQAAYCHEFIQELGDGYQTLVGERGAKLSGGQRQRVGIARAFLKDAPIIVLDEATSGLDSASEVRVQVALARLMVGRTVIAIAHRLSTISSFDRVIVMSEGRIVEDGPPAELLAREGRFAMMWRLQSEGLLPPVVSPGQGNALLE
jgi:ATP-binding cassette subfamily B protein